jgi:hypothetical protein
MHRDGELATVELLKGAAEASADSVNKGKFLKGIVDWPARAESNTDQNIGSALCGIETVVLRAITVPALWDTVTSLKDWPPRRGG